VTLIDERIDDVLFVAGDVHVLGTLRGMGTLIATGRIHLSDLEDEHDDATAPPVVSSLSFDDAPAAKAAAAPDPATRLSLLSYADVSIGPRKSLRGVVRARGRIMVGERASFEGALVADRDVELGPGSRVAHARFGDTVSPALTILTPPQPVVLEVPSLSFTVLYADASAGVDLASLVVTVGAADVTAGCMVAANAATCAGTIGASGEHTLAATIRDLAGNHVTHSVAVAVALDLAPPLIAIETPTDGAVFTRADTLVRGSVEDDGAVALVTVEGAIVEVTAGRFEAAVTLAEGDNTLRVVARDSAGKESERSIAVVLDSEPPRLSVRSPAADGTTTNRASIRIVGDAADERGIEAVEIGGAAVPLTRGVFDEEVALEEGANRIGVVATDLAGNAASIELVVERVTVPAVAILAPADGALVFDQTVDVGGTVDDPGAIVTVNGAAAVVSGTSFLLEDVSIGDGATLLNVIATSASGRMGFAGVTVVRDAKPPGVLVEAPRHGAVVYGPTVPVVGRVNDVVVGTVNSAQVTVTLNGEPAEVVDRSFVLDALALELGDNVIAAEAIDPSGNVGRHTISVRREVPDEPTIAVLSGDRQTGISGAVLAAPLVAIVRDATGAALASRAVTFLADGTDGGFAGGAQREIAVATDGAGRAAVDLTLGRRAGHQRVRAIATGVGGEAVFLARALAGEPALLVADSGDQQTGATGGELRAPFAIVVIDVGFNRLEGVPVRFEVLEGDGRFENGESAIDLVSDSDGRATARLTLGEEEGIGNNVAQARIATFEGDARVTFAASALAAGDPAATSVSGVVLDNSDQPVPGATVSLEGSELSVRTDASGFFRLIGAPVGTLHLRVDGSTVEREGVWPSLEFLITTVAGRDNGMGRPLFLPRLQTENALTVDETTGGVLAMEDLPGFALHVAPGTVTFPRGQRAGVLTVTPVHSDKVPMPPNFGQQPRFVITIQPGGARFDPPAPVSYPNVDGLAPGQVTELYSFDHDLARFVGIGPGIVTGDGTRIDSAPGVGIAKAGWHGGGDPDRPGTCHDCGDCRQPSGGACVADDSVPPRQNAPDDCKMESCVDGRVVSQPDPGERPRQIDGDCFDQRCGNPKKVLDLTDAPAPRLCCGNAEFNAPIGRLAGLYEPEHECCVGDGLFVVSKGPPMGSSLDLCPEREDVPDVATIYDGCSGGLVADVYLHATGMYSGNRDNPTPGDGTGSFSEAPSVPDPPALACDRHDDCYQTCDSDSGARQACDKRFREDMNRTCAGLEGIVLVSDPEEPDGMVEVPRSSVCQTFAEIYHFAVQQLGDGAFEDGQRRHCKCCP